MYGGGRSATSLPFFKKGERMSRRRMNNVKKEKKAGRIKAELAMGQAKSQSALLHQPEMSQTHVRLKASHLLPIELRYVPLNLPSHDWPNKDTKMLSATNPQVCLYWTAERRDVDMGS